MYKFGTIVLIPFPFTDLSSSKLRPGLIISKSENNNEDVIVCFISSKTQKAAEKSDFTLKTSHKDFPKTGLKTNSIFKFNKIATLNKKLILGELGKISPKLIKDMKTPFKESFGF